ncbi:hypothetical protein MAPG_01692 [Magnaporthiopsis poae ATCC 64411]|uniref:Uncharacterized protein n=1 Tax=Magnaporthiopsis poae (strain ATCC 64411 / 73-15) TaxID=644358 RepID=A0A0C4DPC8_MAGP6|nr:hypothetical protein MAPG_01692 [Magnaporthiopsis poae ATCC 64411]
MSSRSRKHKTQARSDPGQRIRRIGLTHWLQVCASFTAGMGPKRSGSRRLPPRTKIPGISVDNIDNCREAQHC